MVRCPAHEPMRYKQHLNHIKAQCAQSKFLQHYHFEGIATQALSLRTHAVLVCTAVNLTRSRITQGTNFGSCQRENFQIEFTKTHPTCGQRHSVGLSPRLSEKEKARQAQDSSLSAPDGSCNVTPFLPPSWWTVSPNWGPKEILPFFSFFVSGILSHQGEK